MIFAAGLGSRLKPLTDNTPKALIKLNNIPLLEHVISKLIHFGVNEIIINVHYLSHHITDFLKQKDNFGIRIDISDETNQLLDTGGGLKKASWFFNTDEPFILYNADIISDINLSDMMNYHSENDSLATLAVRKRKSSRYFLFNNNFDLCGWKNEITSEEIITRSTEILNSYAFSGIHIINPIILQHLNQSGKFSIVKSYLKLCKTMKIKGFDHTTDYWFDIGDMKKLQMAEKFIKEN